MKKISKSIINFLIIICIFVLCVIGYRVGDYAFKYWDQLHKESALLQKTESLKTGPKILEDDPDAPTAAMWQKMHEGNADYVGWLRWASRIVDQPLMQGPDDNYYLHLSYDEQYVIGGSAFVDADTELTDQNIMIYGHTVFWSWNQVMDLMFSPLLQMTDESFFKENRFVKIYWEACRSIYEIFAVCPIDIAQDPWMYEKSVFSSDQDFNDWITHAKEISVVDSDISIDVHDNLVTFQTCTSLHGTGRLVLVGKEISRVSYPTVAEAEVIEKVRTIKNVLKAFFPLMRE